MEFRLGHVHVKTCFTNHPGVCVAYRLETRDGVIVYMPDNETKRGFDGEDGRVADPSEKELLAFLSGADVVIMDSQYTGAEYELHLGWGHGCIDEVVRLCMEARVKRLYTFHHDPAHDDAFITGMLEHAREIAKSAGSPLVIEAAREGVEVTVQAAAR